jgi:hypothetical protein
MPEYLGYQGRGTQVDWTKQFGALAEQISGIESRRKAEKEELDAMNKLDMTLFQMGENQSMNSFVLNGADNIRSKMLEWNNSLKAGQLSPKEYKNKINNVKEYWEELATTAKSFDDRYMKQMERKRDGYSSGLETYGLEKLADFQNIESKSVYVDDTTGRILLSNTDQEGRYVGEPIDINHINNPGNIVDNRVDLNSKVAEKVDNWEVFQQFDLLKRGATQSIEDVRLNPYFNQAVNELSYSLLSTPNAVASIMSDNGVAGKYEVGEISFPIRVDFFMEEAEKDAKVQEQIERIKMLNENVDADIDEKKLKSEIEKYMIEVRRDANGTMIPVITEDHLDIAKNRIQREIEMQLGHKEKKTPKYKPTKVSSLTPYQQQQQDEEMKEMLEGYKATLAAFDGDFYGLDVQNYSFKTAKEAKQTGVDQMGDPIIGFGDNIVQVYDKEGNFIEQVNSPRGLAKFTYGKTAATSQEMWQRADDYIKSARQSNTNTGSYVGVPEGGF